ncbi:hypothetical protein HPB47_008130 [Ixodes persulcatus]|uniref:Uncharacterized protein n=1 Tax=Ixodes persulcatus TaxID=34615 RepID=A0AC60P6C6_IXOPE|nr:hypothetical protein HPB47_008130 [Ixodes persulcatus]
MDFKLSSRTDLGSRWRTSVFSRGKIPVFRILTSALSIAHVANRRDRHRHYLTTCKKVLEAPPHKHDAPASDASATVATRRSEGIRVGALALNYTSPVQPEAVARSVAADASRFDRLWMPKLSSLLNYSAPQLEKHSSVCELHFHKRYVSRHFEHVVNGELVRIDRSRPVLLPGAVPTQFPNLPKYLSKQLPPKRKLPARTECPAPPRKKRVDDVCPPASVDFEEVSSCTLSFQDLALPSCAACKHLRKALLNRRFARKLRHHNQAARLKKKRGQKRRQFDG